MEVIKGSVVEKRFKKKAEIEKNISGKSQNWGLFKWEQ